MSFVHDPYFVYSSYSLLIAIWVLYDAPQRKVSRWFVLGVFIFPPILVPLYFIKTRPTRACLKGIGLWIAGLVGCIVVANIYAAYISSGSAVKELASSVKELASRSAEVKASINRFQNAFDELQKMDVNTVSEMRKAIGAIEEAERLLYEANMSRDMFLAYINEHTQELGEKEVNSFIALIGGFGTTLEAYYQGVKEYFYAYKKVLEYCTNNYHSIYAGREPETQKYDELYSKCEIAFQKVNKAYVQHVESIQRYLDEHPEVSEKLKEAKRTAKKLREMLQEEGNKYGGK